MDKNKFNGIMARAQQLMLDENFNRRVESSASAYSGKKSGTFGDSEISMMESQLFGGGNDTGKKVQMIQSSYQPQNQNLNALPEFMRESFEKMPPIQGDVSDVMPTAGLEQVLNVNQAPRKTVNENIIPTSSSLGGVDYSLIKTIIDESVSRHIKQINESQSPTFVGMRLVDGNKFQFIDGKGNLFEGVLKLKKRSTKQ